MENLQQSLKALAVNGTVITKLTLTVNLQKIANGTEPLMVYYSINGVNGKTNLINGL